MKYLLTGQQTKRLKFRLLKQDDFDTWIDLFKADNVGEYLEMDSLCRQLKCVPNGLRNHFTGTIMHRAV